MNPNELKIKYFIDYWRDLTHPQNSIESDLRHSIIYNPKELFEEFSTEIRRNNLSNQDNREIFQINVKEFSQLDLKSTNFLKNTLSLILMQYSKKDNYSYLLHLLEMIQTELNDFRLGKEAVKELAEILTDNSILEGNKVKHLVNLIYFELVHKKYSNNTIIEVVNNLFSTYHMVSTQLITTFPHAIKYPNTGNDENDSEKYVTEIKTYIDNLTYKDRILAINNLLEKEPRELKFIFQIKGLRGEDINIKIGNVQIYNPQTTKLSSHDADPKHEMFDSDPAKNIVYCNGAIALNVIDIEYAKQEAIQLLETALNFISSRYQAYKIPLATNKSKYIIIDNNGKEQGRGSTSTAEILSYSDSLIVCNEDFKIIENFVGESLNRNLLPIDKKIIESVHWKRKAMEASDQNEQILWYWVALENLFDKPNIIFDVIPKMLARRLMYGYAHKHYKKLNSLLSELGDLGHYRLKIALPDALKVKLAPDSQGMLDLRNLINIIDEIQLSIPDEILLCEQLSALKEIFTNTNTAGKDSAYNKLLSMLEKISFEKLVYVYRMRNKIVHNANSKNSPLANLYVEFISDVTAVCSHEFIAKRVNFKLENNIDIINNMIYEHDKFRLNLKEKGAKALLE